MGPKTFVTLLALFETTCTVCKIGKNPQRPCKASTHIGLSLPRCNGLSTAWRSPAGHPMGVPVSSLSSAVSRPFDSSKGKYNLSHPTFVARPFRAAQQNSARLQQSVFSQYKICDIPRCGLPITLVR
ncbi:hypothetical protein SCHPADRAFT_11673 [Schizopora paradoxa]|uniref:Secreted protein n=1 Tax=Schizopora paradoxa TaxID=27342 RepID=A0A0H2S8I3_9AGAM|nr:hypothetical protein SCHPADRAFT_11673 [Schizopora paradoxa]